MHITSNLCIQTFWTNQKADLHGCINSNISTYYTQWLHVSDLIYALVKVLNWIYTCSLLHICYCWKQYFCLINHTGFGFKSHKNHDHKESMYYPASQVIPQQSIWHMLVSCYIVLSLLYFAQLFVTDRLTCFSNGKTSHFIAHKHVDVISLDSPIW